MSARTLPRGLATLAAVLVAHASAAAQSEVAAPPAAQSEVAAPPAAQSEESAPSAAGREEAALPTAEAPAPALAEPAADPATGTPAPEAESYGLSASELTELGLGGEVIQTDITEHPIEIYGFVDFSLYTVVDEKWRRALQPHASFFIGNFNLYISKNLTDTVRTFSEVRFTYLPNGNPDPVAGTVFSTSVFEYTDYASTLRWGAIEIERIYLEWSITPWLALRLGQFLTPYGIWNVDHGSPTFIPVLRPYVISMNLLPERQTGLELRGQVALSSHDVLGYHLTLSNGTGPISEYRDLDDNKALGARAYWTYDGFGELTIGASAYYGTNADTTSAAGIDENQKLVYTEKVNSKSRVLSWAADFAWRYDALLVQGELVTRQTEYTSDGRPVLTHPLTGVRMGLPNELAFGYYVLVGYRFDWFGTMPFVTFQHVDYVEPRLNSRPKAYIAEMGLNIRPIDSVALKAVYQHGIWPDGFVISDDPLQAFYFQVAWAF